MPKFSIIVPAYNMEKYIKRTLDSIKKQTFKDYEVIVIDDGSTDKTVEVAKKAKVKVIEHKHAGLSVVRNAAIKEAKGDYIVMLDSDDWWDKDLLKKLDESSKNDADVIRFQIRTVTDNGEEVEYHEEEFTGLNGVDAFKKITSYHYLDSACIYAVKRKYYQKEKFAFAKDRVHEDFGTVPLWIVKANKVNCIDYTGYNYYRRSDSIMNTEDYEWKKKKADDFFYHYKYLINEINKTDLDSSYFKSFISNSLIVKMCTLKGKDYKKYKKLIKEEKVYDNLLVDTLPRKIKKQFLKISPKLFYKLTK